MESKKPIGFQGIFSDQSKSYIGFEQYEVEQKETVMPAYPSDDVMPSARQTLRNTSSHSDSSSSISKTMHSSSSSHSNIPTTKKSLSYPQLFAIYNEIVNEWFNQQWFIFDDNHKETYLTLNSHINEFLTVQMAINQYQLTTGTTSLLSQPECLLIRTKSKAKTLFLPNSIVSIENLYDDNIVQTLFRYKLLAIICHSNETNSKLMFYNDFQSNYWYIYYDQSISSHSHSNRLSNEEQFQLESFIQPTNQINHVDLSKFTSPLSALCNHPIIYVYIPERNNKQISH